MRPTRQGSRSARSGRTFADRAALVVALGVVAAAIEVAWGIAQRATLSPGALAPSLVLVTLALLAMLARLGIAAPREQAALSISLVLTIAGALALPIAHREHARARLAEEEARLAAILDDPWLTPLALEHGFAGASVLFVPQASPREAVRYPGWCADERDGAEIPPLGAVPGLVVHQTEDGAFHVDPLHLALPDALRATRREDVRWIALAHRIDGEELDRALGAHASGRHGERIDLRVIDLSRATRLARISCGAVALPGSRGSEPIDLDRVAAALASVIIDGPAERLEPSPPAWPAGASCPAPSEVITAASDLECAHGATPECRAACEAGSASSCMVVAFGAQHREDEESASWFRRGCELGDQSACTNFAVWLASTRSDDEAGACATQLYDHACRADDPFACGMWGAAIARGDGGRPPDRERASARLVHACEELGHFACAMLGTLKARGELDGTFDEADAAFRRACATGYRPSCTQHAADFVSGAAGI